MKSTHAAKCAKCERYFWISQFDPSFPAGPFICPECRGGKRTEGETGRDDDAPAVTLDDDGIKIAGKF